MWFCVCYKMQLIYLEQQMNYHQPLNVCKNKLFWKDENVNCKVNPTLSLCLGSVQKQKSLSKWFISGMIERKQNELIKSTSQYFKMKTVLEKEKENVFF